MATKKFVKTDRNATPDKVVDLVVEVAKAEGMYARKEFGMPPADAMKQRVRDASYRSKKFGTVLVTEGEKGAVAYVTRYVRNTGGADWSPALGLARTLLIGGFKVRLTPPEKDGYFNEVFVVEVEA